MNSIEYRIIKTKDGWHYVQKRENFQTSVAGWVSSPWAIVFTSALMDVAKIFLDDFKAIDAGEFEVVG